MEREFVGVSINHRVSRADLQTVADHACKYYRIKPIRVVVFNAPEQRVFGSFNYCEDETGEPYNQVIRLNSGFHGANVTTLLHELAHYIVDSTYEGHAGHGKKFVGVYMHLLEKYRIIPSDAFRVIAKRRGIEIAGKFKPAAIRG